MVRYTANSKCFVMQVYKKYIKIILLWFGYGLRMDSHQVRAASVTCSINIDLSCIVNVYFVLKFKIIFF